MKKVLAVEVGKELGQFSSLQDWVNRAQETYQAAYKRIKSKNVLTLDSKNRVMLHGGHFGRADKEGTYPVTIYEVPND